jgi:transaldolase
MQLFLDSADEGEVAQWLTTGVIDGVTTNPTILRRERWPDLRSGVQSLARLIAPRPLSVEVYATGLDEMIEQGVRFAGWAENVVVKVPAIGGDGTSYLDVVHALQTRGVRVNCTACLSFCQGVLAAKAGATYVSVLTGRIDDEGGDGPRTVGELCSWLSAWRMPTRVIVGSVRCPRDFQACARAGAHVITAPTAVLGKLIDHRYSRATAEQFTVDGRAAFERSVVTVGVR